MSRGDYTDKIVVYLDLLVIGIHLDLLMGGTSAGVLTLRPPRRWEYLGRDFISGDRSVLFFLPSPIAKGPPRPQAAIGSCTAPKS
jgi:hypothetical protein